MDGDGNEFLDDAKTADGSIEINLPTFDDPSLPSFKKWDTNRYYDYVGQVVDYESLEELNTSIREARFALFRVMEDINLFERQEKTAKAHYERQHRRAYMSASGRTEAIRRAAADLQCENLENDAMVFEQARLELTRLSNTLRLELQTLQALGNNLRQQMKME